MIYELPKHDFYKCKSLVNKHGQLEVKAVIEGVNPGRIFVDNRDTPMSALLWLGNNDGFYFIGDEDNESFTNQLNNFLDELLIPEAKGLGLKWFEGIGNHSKWNKTIEKIFAHRKLGSWNQKVYTLDKGNFQATIGPIDNPDYKVFKITKELYDNTSTGNIEFLHSKILEFWSSPETFFQEGLGYCAVYRNVIVSVCFSGFVFNNVHCIDIETLKEHRGKNLAQVLAYNFVTECLNNDFVPYWDCMEGNKPSVAIAEKLGFDNVLNYVGYEFQLE